MLVDFRNEPLTDFAVEANRGAMQKALKDVGAQLGQTYPLRIGGERIVTDAKIESVNPAMPSQVVGRVAKASADLARRAVETAARAFETWKNVAPEARARVLFRAAALMRRRKHEFSAWMVYEVGKSWAEADGDTAEAIDFMEFYAREMIRLAGRQPLTRVPGEDNELYYIPLGVAVVIPPWNFPLAITTGMATAAVVAGNTVVLKPASVSPVIVARMVDLLEEAGVPSGVVNFCPGSGGEVGDILVQHPLTRLISFTGSREVGLRLNELAAKPSPGQKWIKRVIAEMGGKDTIIVDEDADLEAAAAGIASAAFGFQGQKCSACSRAVVHEKVYDQVLLSVVKRTKEITVGPPVDPAHWMGPCVDRGQFEKVLEYIEIGKKEGRLVCGGSKLEREGWFVQPTIFADVAPMARIAQEEIFGPVLAFLKAKNWDEAIAIANNTDYGLTGAAYSRSRARLEQARRDFHVGNLYLNRKCTGALVDVHPFGGFNMSGTDSKAGGRDYLLLYLQAKSVSEGM